MGQIKNIKLHIVTDIKCNNELISSTFEQDDERNSSVWKETQQISHPVCSMWSQLVPHPEENMCLMWLPKCQEQKFQLGFQSQEKKHHWYWTYETYEESSSKKFEWIPRGNCCQIAEEICCPVEKCRCSH